jgi:ubiquinone/menaquinone biosynthesis C-methylase UbiE
MSFQIFAHYYDEIMDQSVYDSWLRYVEKYTNGEKGLNLMDLACGTGKIAVQLAKKGHHVTGIDLSDEMLAVAYNRMLEEKTTLTLAVGDMRALEPMGDYDVITCFSDSLCYLANEEEVLSAFKGVSENLSDTGIFLFDVHSLYQVNEVFPGYQYIYQDEKGAFLWESFEGESENSVEHDLTFFVATEANPELFERYAEYHRERTYPLAVYRRLLQEAGFSDVTVTADFGDAEVAEDSKRWFFACKK